MLKYPELYKTSQNAMGFNTKVGHVSVCAALKNVRGTLSQQFHNFLSFHFYASCFMRHVCLGHISIHSIVNA